MPDNKPKQKLSNSDKRLASALVEARNTSLQKQLNPTILGADSTAPSGGMAYNTIGYGKAARKGNWNAFAAPEDMALKAFEQQSTEDLVYDTVVGGTKRFGAGFLDSIGAWDVSNMTSMAMSDASADYSNWFNNLGKKLTSDANEQNQIYQDPNNSVWNGAYLANQVQQLGYTGGIIAEMVAENVLLDWATGGTQNLAAASKLKYLSNLGKDALFGMSQGIKEAHMNALETQNNVYQKYKQLGFSDEQALAKSKEAASIHFKTESGALAVMNGLQNMLFLGSLSRGARNAFTREGFKSGFSDAFETVGEKAFGAMTDKIGNKTLQKGLNKAGGWLALGGSEAIEEGIQTGIGTYASNKVAGKDTNMEDLMTYEMRDSMIGGALGGVLLGAGFKALGNFRNKGFSKNYKNFIENTLNTSYQAFENENQAFNIMSEKERIYNENPNEINRKELENSKLEYNRTRNQTHLNNIVSSLAFDYSKGSGSTVAFDMQTKHMQDVLDAVKTKDTDKLIQFGLIDNETGKEKYKDSFKTILDTYEDKIKDANKIKEFYNDTLTNITPNFDIATDIIGHKFNNYKNRQDNIQENKDLQEVYSKDELYNTLSPEGKRRFTLETEKESLNLFSSNKEHSFVQDRIKEIESELEDLKGYSSTDKMSIPDDISKIGYMLKYGNIANRNINIFDTNEKIKTLSKPESVIAEVKKRKEQELNKAKSKEEVQDVLQDAKEEGTLTPELEQKAQSKVSDFESKEILSDEAKSKESGNILESSKESTQDINDIFDDEVGHNELTQEQLDDINNWVKSKEDLANQAFSRETIPGKDYSKLDRAANQTASRLDAELGRESNFQDFIEESIKQRSYKEVEDKFNFLKNVWNLTGRDISNADTIYNNVFNSINSILDVADEYLEPKSEEDFAITTKQVENNVQETTASLRDFDVNGNPEIKDVDDVQSSDRRTAIPDLKGAFHFLDSKRMSDTEWKVVSKGLKISSLIPNNYILDPELQHTLVKNKATLTIREVDDNNVPVTLYGDEIVETTWGEYKKNIEKGSREWYQKVPMVAYIGDIALFSIHDPAWYNPRNISDRNGKDKQSESIIKGFDNTLKLRENVSKGFNEIQIDSINFGSIDKLNQHINQTPISINEATGQSILAVKTSKGLLVNIEKQSFEQAYSNAILLNNSMDDNTIPQGAPLDIRYAGKDNITGKDTYMVLPVMNYSPVAQGALKQDLNQNIFNNIKYAVLAATVLNNISNKELIQQIENKFKFTLEDARTIQEKINSSLRINITNDINDYVSLFLNSTQLNKPEVLKEGLTYFEKTEITKKDSLQKLKGVVLFNKAYTGSTKNKTSILGTSVDAGREESIIRDLDTFFNTNTDAPKGLLSKSVFKLNLQGLGKRYSTIDILDDNGKFTGNSKSYEDFAKDNLYSNVLSHKIDTLGGQSKWIIDVQPMVYFSQNVETSSQPTIIPENIASVDVNILSEDVKPNVINDLKSAGLSQEDIELLRASGIIDVNTLFNSRIDITPEQNEQLSNLSVNSISSLSNQEQKELVNSLKNLIVTKLDFNKSINYTDLKEGIKNSIENFLIPILKQNVDIYNNISKLPSLQEQANKLALHIDKINTIVEEKEKLLRTEKGNEGDLIKEFNKLFGRTIEELEEEDNSSEESFSKSFLEKDIKLSYSDNFRLNLLGIPLLRNKNNEQVKNFLGFNTYNSADEVELKIKEITTDIPSDWNMFMNRLEDKAKSSKNPLYSQIKSRFENMPDHTKQELLYKLISKKVQYDKIITTQKFEKGKDSNGNEITILSSQVAQVIDENSTKEDLKLRNYIKHNFKYNSDSNTAFVENNDAYDKVLNLAYTVKYQKRLQELISKNSNKNTESKEDIKKIFKAFGLGVFNENTIEEYLMGNNPFKANDGVLWFANEKLKHLIKEEQELNKTGVHLDMTSDQNYLYGSASTALNKLINTEIKLNGSSLAKAIRIAGKTMQGTAANTFIQDAVTELKNKGDLFNLLKKTQLAKNNTILKLLEEDPNFNNAFGLSFTSPDFYKIHGKNNSGDTEIDKLAEMDNMSAIISAYTMTKGYTNLIKANTIEEGLKFRLAKLPTTTLADKGRLLLLTTAVLNLGESDLQVIKQDIEDRGFAQDKFELSPILADYLVDQLFVPEFNRIVESYELTKSNKPTNIIGYDNTSKIFITIPAFNTLEVSGKNIHQQLANGEVNPEVFREEARNVIKDWVNFEVDKKITSSEEFPGGEYVDFGIYDESRNKKILVKKGEFEKTVNESKIRNLDTEYINTKPGETELEKLRFMTAEYVINNILNQNNIYSLFLGDQAFYAKGREVPMLDNRVDYEQLLKDQKYSDIAEKISLIIDKRAASLIAPGNKFANSETRLKDIQTEYIQVQVNDVESMSSSIKEYLEMQYGELNKEQNELYDNIVNLNNQINKLYEKNNFDEANKLIDERNSKIKSLSKTAPDIADYFNITGTDAQEYTTWQTHLDMLYRQGNLTSVERERVVSAYNKMSEGKFEDVTKDELVVIMQSVKPVYTGLIEHKIDNERSIARPIYIKSSSFPLLPQVTKNLKIDEVRKKLEQLESKTGRMVRMSYQTANKIGATKTSLSMNDLYHKSFEELYNDSQIEPQGLLATSHLVLPTKNLKIQQETPYKQGKYFKKGKDAQTTLGSQFWKTKLGNGVNRMGPIFDSSLFNKALLDTLEIKPIDGKLSGSDLDKIDFHIYNEYSNLQKQILFDEFGIEENKQFSDLSLSDQNRVMESLISIIEKEVAERNYPDYLQEVVSLVKEKISEDSYRVSTEIPLMLDSNTNKFESLMQALVSARLISHKLPGNGHIATSSEGFNKKSTLDELSDKDRTGIVWINGITQELKPTYTKDGVLRKSQVLIQSHYSYTTSTENGQERKYVDLTSDDYSEPILEDGKIVGRQLRLDKIDKELLDMFAFRIPTSSHQSGTIVEVVGFLPKEAGDMIVVPKEHTTQLGEDYDIDKRYIYKSNYYVGKDGSIKKIQYSNRNEYEQLPEEIKEFMTLVDNSQLSDFHDIIADEDRKERMKYNKARISMLENTMIDIYKTIFSSNNNEMQKKVFKPLVTDIAEDTGNWIQDRIKSKNPLERKFFSSSSDRYQRYLLKLGADGKGGIGVHSNAVTLEAQLQRLEDKDKVKFVKLVKVGDELTWVPSKEVIGGLVSDGILGNNIKALESEEDIANQHGENQNVSTDNINKQIMVKRNENSYTMSVYALMAHRGFYTSKDEVIGPDFKTKNISIPSLFMSQPILIDYVKLRQSYDSISADFASQENIDKRIIAYLADKYDFMIDMSIFEGFSTTKFLDEREYENKSAEMTGQRLYDNLKQDIAMTDPDMQAAVLQKFLRLKAEAQSLSKYQSLINLSTSQLGVSYFETLQRIATLNELAYKGGDAVGIQNVSKLIGDFRFPPEVHGEVDTDNPEFRQAISQGYKLIGDVLWKPTTIEGVMLINSLSAAQSIMGINFPYHKKFISDTINDIFVNKDKDPNVKSALNLKWKYDIMSSYRDFLYTIDDIGMFNNLEEEKKRLFIDNKTNSSLASILNDLYLSRNPIMQENALLKDMTFKVRNDGQISQVVHQADHNSSFDKSTKYEAFKELLADDVTILGTYNGEQLTPRKLAQDLATYAYIADDQNGATGFRNYIHIDYLKTLGITRNIRDIYNKLQEDSIFAEVTRNRFVKQYFQHNPDKAFILSQATINVDRFTFVNQKAEKIYNNVMQQKVELNVLLNNLESFSLSEPEDGKNPKFVSIRDTGVVTDDKNKMYKLFELVDGVYQKVEILGNLGFNEYNANISSQTSILPRTGKEVLAKMAESVNPYVNRITRGELGNNYFRDNFKGLHTVEGIVDTYLVSPKTREEVPGLFNFLNETRDLINTDVEIELTKPARSLASYDYVNDKILIDPNIYEELLFKYQKNMDKVRGAMREILIEEVIHASTIREFNRFIENQDENGNVTLIPNAPVFATKLVALFNTAREQVPYDPSDKSTYYSQNIYEFTAGMFVAEDYKQLLESKKAGFIDKFVQILKNLFKHLYNQETGEVLDYKSEMFNSVRELMKSYKQSLEKGNTDISYKNIIDNNLNSRIIQVDSNNFSNFAEEAFKCK